MKTHTKKIHGYDFIPVFRKGGIQVLGLCLEKLNYIFPLGDFRVCFQQLLGISFQQFQNLQAPVWLPALPLLHVCIFTITSKVGVRHNGSGCPESSIFCLNTGVSSPPTPLRTNPN